MMPELIVLDASVGVKWFEEESGSDEARELLRRHRAKELLIAVPSHFVHEVMAVAVRNYGTAFAERVWQLLQDAMLTVLALDDEVATEALRQSASLGCSFYDALAPAVAVLVGGQLCSADRRAHGRIPGALIL